MNGSPEVLVVDDDRAIRIYIQRVLEDAGYSVCIARDAVEAVTLFDRHRATLALLLTDVLMPGMSGPVLAAQLQAANPTLRILFISGFCGEHADECAAAAYLAKPFTPRELMERVADLVPLGEPA